MKRFLWGIVGMILALLGGSPGEAADFVIPSGQTVTTTQSLADGETGIVEAGGAIQILDGRGPTISGSENTTIINAGILTSPNSFFGIFGISVGADATIQNSGTITTTTTSSRVVSLGSNSGAPPNTGTFPFLFSTSNFTLINTGLITSTGIFSIGINHDGGGTIINTGTIATDRSGILGVGIGPVPATIINHGIIVSSQRAAIDEELNSMGLTITNSGLISGNPAIRFSRGPNQLNILSGSRFRGGLEFPLAGNNQVDISWKNEVSSLWNFDGFDTGSGDSISVSTPNPYVVTNSAVSIIDPTGFASAATSLADLTSSLHGTIHRHLRPTGLVRKIPQHAQQSIQIASTASMVPIPPKSSAWNYWLQGFGGKTQREKERATLGYDHQSWGVIVGGTLFPSSRVRVGLFGGLADSKTDVDQDAQTLDALSGFGGIFGQFALETWFLQSSFAGGITSTDSHRLVLNNLAVSGSQRANADYTSGFISTAMTGGIHVRELLDGISLRPSVSLAYAAEWIPDYQESGSSADLTVDDRVVQILTGQVEMAVLLAHFNNRLRQEIRGGGFGRDQIGSKNVRVILLNQPLSFDPNTEDSIFGGFAGYGVAYDLMNTVTISADYGAQFSKDIFSHNVRLGLAVGF